MVSGNLQEKNTISIEQLHNVLRYLKKNSYSIGAKSMSPVDIELLFVILYNIIVLHHNTNIFSIEIQ